MLRLFARLIRRWEAHRRRYDDRVLIYLLEHGEAPGRVIGPAVHIARHNWYLVLHHIEERGLIQSRVDPADIMRVELGGAARRLYKLTGKGVARLKELKHPATQPLQMLH